MTTTTDQPDGSASTDPADYITGLDSHTAGIIRERREALAARLEELPAEYAWQCWPVRSAIVEACHLAAWAHNVREQLRDTDYEADSGDPFCEALEAAAAIARSVETMLAEAHAAGRAEAIEDMTRAIPELRDRLAGEAETA